jgi:signal transduction histidine kinase/CheY-like chemotaxis protein
MSTAVADRRAAFFRHSLRWRMPFMISTLLLGVVAAFAWSAHQMVESTLIRATGERAQNAAERVAGLLDARRSEDQIRAFAQDTTVRAALDGGLDDARDRARARLQAFIGTGVRRVQLWNVRGDLVLDVSVPVPASGSTAPIELPRGSVPSHVGFGPLQMASDLVYYDVVMEVVDDDAGRDAAQEARLGYLVARGTFQENPPGIFSRLVGRGALVRIGNRTGDVWAGFSHPAAPEPVDLARPGIAQYRARDGEMRLGAVSLIPGTPWAAWVEFPLADAVAPARAFLVWMVPVALLFVAVGAAVAAALSAGITAPLRTLSTASGAIASGDYSQRVPNNRHDEIGQLGHAFNHMAEEIQHSQQRLEARVIERTAELNEARLAADRANQAKSEFLSRMSHELRTPLNAIMGFAQVLQLDSVNDEQRDAIGHILRGGRHLLGLINEVLDVARIEAGALSLSPEPVAIGDIVQHAVDLIRPLATERGLTISIDPLPSTFVRADRQRLNQILFNLLSNAVKYNRAQGTVRVFSPPAEAGRVQIVVADTGAGIPPNKLALLFTPFERLGAEQTLVEGTGLGLALAKGLTEAMKGSLTVRSVVDEGTQFRVELPAAESPVVANKTPLQQAVTYDDSTGTILYIEDNMSNVRLMERLIKRRPGVTLFHARDGRSGIEMTREQRPDLVFLDLHLPDTPGDEVLRQIWEDPEMRGIPVVVLSADATPAQRRRLLACGARAYLTKPFDIAEVLLFIDETLAGAGAASTEPTN